MNIGNMAKGINSVDRYEVTASDELYIDKDQAGDWVRYTDYAALQQQLAAAHEARQAADANAARWEYVRDNFAADMLDLIFGRVEEPGSNYDDAAELVSAVDQDMAQDATLQRDRQP